MDTAAPDNVVTAWLLTRDFLRLNAPRTWSWMMQHGVTFVMPPAAEILPDADQRARYLAEREQRRLEQAELYHCDVAATHQAMAMPTAPVEAADPGALAPSPAGFVVWSEPVARTDDGVPVIAASWGPVEPQGVWVSWWSDTEVAAQVNGSDARDQLAVMGPLSFDRETWLRPGVLPSQLTDRRDPEHHFFQALFGTWNAIAHGVVTGSEVTPAARVRKQARRAGLPERVIHTYRSAPTSSPQPSEGTDPSAVQVSTTDGSPCLFAASRDHELPQQVRWIPELYRASFERVTRVEDDLLRRWPGVFSLLDEVREASSQHWPRWCWMPIARVIRVLGELVPDSRVTDRVQDASKVAAVGAWRAAGRPVANLHDTLEAEFSRRSHAGEVTLPRDLPQRWPVQGLYVTSESPAGANGVWIHLEYDEEENRTELRVLLDSATHPDSDSLIAQPLHLTGTTLHAALAATWSTSIMRWSSDEVPVTGRGTEFDEQIRKLTRSFGIYVAIADFLASPAAVVEDAAAVVGRRTPALAWPPVAAGSEPMCMWLVREEPL